MVKINKFCILFLSLLMIGCVHNEQNNHNSQQKVLIGKTEILLDNQTCEITINGQASNIEMEPICYFAKKSNQDDVSVEYFEDIDSHAVVIVEKTGVKDPDFPFYLDRDDCSYKSRALIIKNGAVKVSSKVFDGFSCAGTGLDQKDYWILSH